MNFSSVTDKNELPLADLISDMQPLMSEGNGFIHTLLRTPRFNDEPKYFHYTAYGKKSKDNQTFTGIGCSLNEQKAKIKAIAEAIERYCMFYRSDTNHFRSSYEKIKDMALDPTSIVAFSASQLKKSYLRPFRVDTKSALGWCDGVSLITKKPVLVPSQLASLTYKFGKNEPVIRIPITNGAASGTSMAGAALRGIFECIERDAFVINYLNKLPREKIITSDEDVNDILKLFRRYNLEVHSFDITTDIEIPTVMSIVVDKTGKGPAISVGNKCSLSPKDALIGSIEETMLVRMYMRKFFLSNHKKPKEIDINDHKDRAAYWRDPRMISHLGFLLNSKEHKELQEIKDNSGTTIHNLKHTINILKKKNLETVVVDITKPLARLYGFSTAMVIAPELQPFYLREAYKYLGGRRLYTVPRILGYADRDTTESELNKIPHPF